MQLDTANRISLLAALGSYMLANNEEWQDIKLRAMYANPWFTLEHVEMASNSIANNFLQKEALEQWIAAYKPTQHPKTIGIVMAGNIPMVGFHDLLCGFMSGHKIKIKTSSKDNILIPFLIKKLVDSDASIREQIEIAEQLKDCDAYIATGSNNTTRYFEQYFGKYPNIIRKNRTSVAVLDGTETTEELHALADDIFSYYGLGCRNVTQLIVPRDYNFIPLLEATRKYSYLVDQHKYKNNYDYHLAIYLLNKVQYMSNENMLLVENELPFSAVSVVHYRYYDNLNLVIDELKHSNDIQNIVGKGGAALGTSQHPRLADYADGVDTMQFLCSL